MLRRVSHVSRGIFEASQNARIIFRQCLTSQTLGVAIGFDGNCAPYLISVSLGQHRTIRRTHLACIIVRHMPQNPLTMRQHGLRNFVPSDENSDCAICARELCGVSLGTFTRASGHARHTKRAGQKVRPQSLIRPHDAPFLYNMGNLVSRCRASASTSASISLRCVSGPRLMRKAPAFTFFGRSIASKTWLALPR